MVLCSIKSTDAQKSDQIQQVAQVQNLLASLILLDNKAFIRFEPDSNAQNQHNDPQTVSIPETNQHTEQSPAHVFIDTPPMMTNAFDDLTISKGVVNQIKSQVSTDHTNSDGLPEQSAKDSIPTPMNWTNLFDAIRHQPVDSESNSLQGSTPIDLHFQETNDQSYVVQLKEPLEQTFVGTDSIQPAKLDNTHVDEKWSSISGWGNVNIAKSLEAVLPTYSFVNTHSASNTSAYLGEMGFTYAWANGFTGKGVVIADIDTGFDFHNTFLTTGIDFSPYKWNFVNQSNNVQDDNGHGTMTASEMVADPATGFGICGAAFDAELMVLKALDANGRGTVSQVCEAIYYAVDHGANVINMSLGMQSPNFQLLSAMQYARAHDVVVVAAAGNSAGDSPSYPAAYGSVFSNVIAVGASQTQGTEQEMAVFSNCAGGFEPYNFVTAKGIDLVGFGIENSLWSWTGTSMAAPLVSAQAAILESANHALTARQIIQAITRTADELDIGSDTRSFNSVNTAQSSGTHDTANGLGLANSHDSVIQSSFAIEHIY